MNPGSSTDGGDAGVTPTGWWIHADGRTGDFESRSGVAAMFAVLTVAARRAMTFSQPLPAPKPRSFRAASGPERFLAVSQGQRTGTSEAPKDLLTLGNA